MFYVIWFIPCRCCVWRDVASGELDLPIVDVESDGLGDLSVADVASDDVGAGVASPIFRIVSAAVAVSRDLVEYRVRYAACLVHVVCLG